MLRMLAQPGTLPWNVLLIVRCGGALANNGPGRRAPLADEDLIRLVETGDPEALASLYDRHSRAAYSLARRMTRERQAAEDLVQEAFLKVWRSAGSYRAERGSTRNWILCIVYSLGVDRLRRTERRRRAQDRFEAQSEVQAAKVQPSEAFEQTWSSLKREELREALKTLPSEQLGLLELAYFHGCTHTEIAGLLGLPLGTVKGRIRLGLNKIRDHFEQNFQFRSEAKPE